MDIRKKLGLGSKCKPRNEKQSMAWLEGLPSELVRNEYPNEYHQLVRERTPKYLQKLWYG